ncbi:MAG: hypothetical protein J7619_30675 [Dyadobacter sp.]|uniref:hypothetical protein n=1 Tax=Dyadobacter sp. TaxID=1914288 RepID=UPI001B1B0473|nr:hypothetical protein [Dyadobacter sp.]MBO9617092.1 hypothetical protein [Dyadobacter sp.]
MDFILWNNNDQGGGSDSYAGAQGQENIDANNDSLQTSSGTWVIVFDGTEYTGNIWKINPSTYESDLNHVDRYDSSGSKVGVWKNAIQSFILYKQEPAFWNNSSWPSKSELISLQENQALFTENGNFEGDNRVFTGPYNAGSLSDIGYANDSDKMTGTGGVTALRTGNGSWLIIFDDTDFDGDFLKIGPNVTYPDLNNVERKNLNGDNDGDWKNQIQSFLLYAYQPEFWNTPYSRPYVDFSTFYGLYPYPTSSESDNKVVYMVEDSTYTVDCPDFTEQSTTQSLSSYENDDTTNLPAEGWTKYGMSLTHENPALTRDDTCTFDAYFDNTGTLVSIQHFDMQLNGAMQISQALIDTVDFVAWYYGTTGAIETLGISEEAADAFVDVFDFVTAAFNKFSAAIYKVSDNGGQFYFLPVVCHTLNRLCTTVAKPFNTQIYTQSGDQRQNYSMAFDNSAFPNSLNSVVSGYGSVQNWQQENTGNGGTYPFNQAAEYTYDSYPFRTWYQESSVSAQLGIFVSCKLDYEIGDNSKDDHVILLLGFRIPNTAGDLPTLTFAQATVQFTDGSNTNIMTPPYNNVSSGTSYYASDVIGAVYNYIQDQLTNVTMNSSQQGRKYLADVTQANMQAICNCVSFN